MPDCEEILRRLSLNDDRFVAAVLAGRSGEAHECELDPRTNSLVRLAAVIANDAAEPTYQSIAGGALAAGATPEEVVGVLLAVATTVGSARVVAAAPRVAAAIGYELDAALEST
jgi:4-carboxymuconolactone decarboxylase